MAAINITLLLFSFFTIATVFNVSFTNGRSEIRCIESEKQALLLFKRYLTDPADRLASWVDGEEDCCNWVGIVCDNVTSHVLELHLGSAPYVSVNIDDESLRSSMLGGKIHHSLLGLKHLSYLDLCNNDFGGIEIPKFFGSMGSLTHLNLSKSGFGGMVPHQLGNLSNLQYLNLRGIANYYDFYSENLQWLSGISGHLKHLDLSFVNLGKVLNWQQMVNMLPNLEELHLSNCYLPPAISPHLKRNVSSLAVLDLGGNFLKNSTILSWVFSFKTLVYLDLSINKFDGPIPDGFKNLTSLKYLDLSSNNLSSSIPDWFFSFSPLEYLDLSENLLHGKISNDVGNMISIITLRLSGNNLGGGIPTSFGNLCNLKTIWLHAVNLNQNISDILEIMSPCISNELVSLNLSTNKLFGPLTGLLGNFKNLAELNLEENSISGLIPNSLGELSMLKTIDLSSNKLKGNLPESFGQLVSLEKVDISQNSLEGVVYETHFANLTKLNKLDGNGNSLILKVHPNWIPPFQLEHFDIGSWQSGPKFPSWLHSQKQLTHVDISNSGISDKVPAWFWNMSSQFLYVNISHNQISGVIPYVPFVLELTVFDFSHNFFSGPLPKISINLTALHLANNSLSGSLSYFLCDTVSETMGLGILDLRKNVFVGKIPDCWIKWPNMQVLNLGDNNLTGSIPTSLGMLNFLVSLHLRNNRIHGKLPESLRNFESLVTFDVSGNELNGQIPHWLGLKLDKLMILSLRANKFHGQIPNELCSLGSLLLLDLSQNNLLGNIPKCIDNLTAMATPDGFSLNFIYFGYAGSQVLEDVTFMAKGALVQYSRTLSLVRIIDLSNNNLTGDIPPGVTRLQGLQSLNLSRNHLIGRIPDSIGHMRSLESMDFSVNRLSGSIPQSISNLTFLSLLNLSNNNLVGRIPSSTQILGFDASSFAGNQLCGPPLTHNCSAVQGKTPDQKEEEDDDNGHKLDWFYVAMAIGFGTGFGAFLVPLMICRGWRIIYFQFLEQMWTRLILLYVKVKRFHAP